MILDLLFRLKENSLFPLPKLPKRVVKQPNIHFLTVKSECSRAGWVLRKRDSDYGYLLNFLYKTAPRFFLKKFTSFRTSELRVFLIV